MRQSIFNDGLAARQRAIPLVTALFLVIAATQASAQQKTVQENRPSSFSIPSREDKASQLSPAAPGHDFSSALASGQKSPLVLRPDLIMPKDYKPRDTNVPDFLSLDYLEKPSPLKVDDPVDFRKTKDRKYLSEKAE
jgi:hypothetical protein